MMLNFLYLLELAVFCDPQSPVNPTWRKVLEGVHGREAVFFQPQDFLEHWIFSV